MREPFRINITRLCSARMSPILVRLFVSCIVAVMMCGCHQKELVYPASTMIKVSVVFDWTYAPKASVDGMTVIFFPVGPEGSIWRYELPGQDGGDIEIPAGNYRMLAFNNDTKYILYNGISHLDTYNAYTAFTTPSWPQEAIERYPRLDDYKGYRSPDALYCGSAEDVNVSLCSVLYRPDRPDGSAVNVKECNRHIIRCYPAPRTSTYTCIMRNVTNAESMRRGYCLLTGLSPSELIADDVLSESEGAYTFIAGRKNTEISGKTAAFGRSASESARQYLYLVTVLADGSVASYCYDVSEQVVNSPDKRNVEIIIDGLELPDVKPIVPDDPTTDFDVAVNDWETIIINHVVGLR